MVESDEAKGANVVVLENDRLVKSTGERVDNESNNGRMNESTTTPARRKRVLEGDGRCEQYDAGRYLFK